MTRSLSAIALVGLVTGGLVAACGEDPATRMPTRPDVPSTTGVQIIGPSQVAPGKTAQFVAHVLESDGTTKLIGSQYVRWFSSSPVVLSVNAAGLATGGWTGDAFVTVEVTPYGATSLRRATREIIVVPDGTFRVVGTVMDDIARVPIAGAFVRVVGTTVVAQTGQDGRYRLHGVPPDAELSVTADGYLTKVQPIHITGSSTIDFQLTFNGPVPPLAGNYTVAVDVLDSCAEFRPLAASLRHRSYDAVMTQSGPALQVTLTEPRFRINGSGRGNRFFGQVTGTGAKFVLDWYDYYYTTQYPNVAELLPDGSVIASQGDATLTGNAAGMSGPLSGALSHWGVGFPANGNFLGGCSASLRLTLSPR